MVTPALVRDDWRTRSPQMASRSFVIGAAGFVNESGLMYGAYAAADCRLSNPRPFELSSQPLVCQDVLSLPRSSMLAGQLPRDRDPL